MRKRQWRRRGLTIVEVVLATTVIIGLGTGVRMLGSQARRVARPATCSVNLAQIVAALNAYQTDNDGWLPMGLTESGPTVGTWSSAAWYLPKSELWFYKICPQYLRDPASLVCPADPFADQFDFEAELNGVPHSDPKVPSCGYGLSYVFRHWRIDRLEVKQPMWPDRTIFLAEVGPDNELSSEPIAFIPGDESVGQPWRDGGRMIWDSGARAWYHGPTWLTTRHGKSINVAAVDGSVRKARTYELLQEPIHDRYRSQCYRISGTPYGYVCALCAKQEYHYNFSESNFWWWTGPFPELPKGTQATGKLGSDLEGGR
jgi:prepilin-type processing-associated H-X9-DG protein